MARKFEALRAQISPESRSHSDAKAQAMLDAPAQDIDEQPEILRPVDTELVDRLRSHIAGIEVDLDQPLPPEMDGAGRH